MLIKNAVYILIYMRSLVNRYVPGNEYELRCYFPVDTIWSIYDKMQVDPIKTYQLDISVALSQNSKLRKELYFKIEQAKPKIQETKYMEKQAIGFYMDKIKSFRIKHALSRELDREPFTVSCSDKVTYLIKLRERYIQDDWAWDYTIVLLREDNKAAITDISEFRLDPRYEFFKDEYDRVSKYPSVSLSLEIEYVGEHILVYSDIEKLYASLTSYLEVEGAGSTNWNDILQLISPYIASRVMAKSLSNIINKPVSLDRSSYIEIYNDLDNYYLADKTDGERCLVVLDKKSYYVTTTSSGSLDYKSDQVIILDTEKIQDKFMVFDCLRQGDNYSIFDSFEDRWQSVQKMKLPDYLQPKEMIRITSLDKIPEFYNRSRDYQIDGLIFTPMYRNAHKVRKDKMPTAYYDCLVYKWKPAKQLTIDFLVKKPPKQLVGIYPIVEHPEYKHIYLLCCGISSYIQKKLSLYNIFQDIDSYKPIPFQPSINPECYVYYSNEDLSDIVGEFRVEDDQFKLDRLREDKSREAKAGLFYGNDYKVADITYFSCINPLTLEDFVQFKPGYFQVATKPEEYVQITKFHNSIKTQIISRYCYKKSYVIDLASGKGQDLMKYDHARVNTLMCCDKDLDALEELNKRKYSIKFPMRILIKQVDLVHDNIVDKLKTNMAPDVISIQFAIHYIISTEEDALSLIDAVTELLSDAGLFIFTCFDGARVHELLEINPEWTTEKYSIKRKYTDYGFANLISVRHHFGGYYDEFLLNLEELSKLIKKKGYKLIESKYFDELAESLPPEDIEYTRLYRYMVFRKYS